MNNCLIPLRKQINRIITYVKNEYNPYSAYRIIKKKKLSTTRENNILITNIVGAYSGHVFEGLYARKAMLHGVNVSVLHCGNYLSHCEGLVAMSKYKKIRCANCMAKQDEFVKVFGVDNYSYGMLIDQDDELKIQKYINKYFVSIDGKHIFLETDIDKIVYSALQHYYLMADPVIKDDIVTRGFLRTVLATLIAMDKLVKKLKPKYVMSSHGIYSTWGAVVAYCQSHNIYVITYGQNYNKSGYEFTYDESYLTGVLNDTEQKWKQKNLTENERNRAIRFLDERMGRVASNDNIAFDYNKGNKKRYDRKTLCELLSVSSQKKLAGLFPNIPWDGQVTGTSAVFTQFRDWLKTTVDYFSKRDDAVLIIRSHPAEVLVGANAGRESTTTMLGEMYPQLPSNVILLPPKHEINSYTLGENVDFGITYSTTLTLELTYAGTPVILCGCPPFKNKGIAFDIISKEHYSKLLGEAISGKLIVDEERKEILFKYINYFFFMRTMPQTLIEVKDTVPLKLLFGSEEELDADPVLEDLFRHIEAKKPMDFSRFWTS